MSEQIDSAVDWAAERFAVISESAKLDAELLLAHCLDKSRSYLYSWPKQELSETCWHRFQALVRERLKPTPVAYLLGRREFYSMEYASTPAALVPRPETELLVELALARIPADAALRICDLGTGTGIIAITLKKLRPLSTLLATDIDPGCLALARDNARQHAVEIEFLQSDWYQNLPAERGLDLIVSNPPYVAASHPFMKQGDLPAEPAIALTPGPSGLEALEIIVGGAPNYLKTEGWLLLEHGYDQQAPVANLLRASGFIDIRCESDHNGLPRASLGQMQSA